MKKLYFLLLVFSTTVWGQQKEITITGKVTDGTAPLVNVNITVADSEEGTKTDTKGFYKIIVDEGATLNYSHVGYQNVEIVTEDISRALNIIMVIKVNQLDNVTVTKRKPRRNQRQLREDYYLDKNLINTAFGIIDKDAISYKMKRFAIGWN